MAALAYSSRTRINGALCSVCINISTSLSGSLVPLFFRSSPIVSILRSEFYLSVDTLSSSHFLKHQSWPTTTWTECTLSELLFISLSSKDFSDSIFTTMCINITYCLYKCTNRILCCESQLKYTPIRKCHHSTQCNICLVWTFIPFAVTSKVLYYE